MGSQNRYHLSAFVLRFANNMTSPGKLINKFTSKHTSQIFDVKFDVSRIVRYDAALILFATTYHSYSTSHDRHIVVLDFSHGLDTSLFV